MTCGRDDAGGGLKKVCLISDMEGHGKSAADKILKGVRERFRSRRINSRVAYM